MNHIILDLEWNQPVSATAAQASPVALTGEIIQIGAVKLDEQWRYVDRFKIGVAPKYYKELNQRVRRITGMDQKRLSRGTPFPAAYRNFRNWCGAPAQFFTWGFDDLPMLQENLNLHEIREQLPRTYNLQVIFSDQVTKDNQQWGLARAVEHLQLTTNYSAHDALHDALNTAVICQKLDMQAGLLCYEEAERRMSPNRRYPVGIPCAYCYPSFSAAIQDKKIAVVACPVCGHQMDCGCWVNQNQDQKMAMVSCPEHGSYLVQVKAKQRAGGVSVSQLMYRADPGLQAYYTRSKNAEHSHSRRHKHKRRRKTCSE